MDKERINLGLGGPKAKPITKDAMPYCHHVGDCLADGRSIWRYMAASTMQIHNASVICKDLRLNSVMIEAYYNGQYVAEFPLLTTGTRLNVPIELAEHDVIEIKLATRGGTAALVPDVWITCLVNLT